MAKREHYFYDKAILANRVVFLSRQFPWRKADVYLHLLS
ncbi:MAG: hypothetical protein K940chlam3_00218 [Chlamydiae bacterium]|nr:hypothetical protein [Chlamydiota bacterium]